jgi:hypothetical protein
MRLIEGDGIKQQRISSASRQSDSSAALGQSGQLEVRLIDNDVLG